MADEEFTDEQMFGAKGPPDWLGRNRIYSELKNPAVRDRLIAYTNAEVGGQGNEAIQAFMESIYNRSVARNQTVARTLSGSYFPNTTHNRAGRGVTQGMRDAYDDLISHSLGTNIANYATGNASGTVGFAGGPQTFRAGGERFGIEGPDAGWWSRVGDRGPPSDLAAATPRRGGSILSYFNPVSSAEAAPLKSEWTDAEMMAAPQIPFQTTTPRPPRATAGGAEEPAAAAAVPRSDWTEMTEEEMTGKAPKVPTAPAAPSEGILSRAAKMDQALTAAAAQGVASGLGAAVSGTPATLELLRKGGAGGFQQQMLEELMQPYEDIMQKGREAARPAIVAAGQAIEKAGQETFPVPPEYETAKGAGVNVPYVGRVAPVDVARGAGSLATNIATGVVGGPMLMGLSALAQGAGEAEQRALQFGATPEQQRIAGYLGTIPGATDLVDNLLPMFGSTGKLAAFIGKVGARAIKGAIAEGGQEGFQQFLQNAIARGIYDPNADLGQDVAKSALVGALVGAPATAVLGRHDEPSGPTMTDIEPPTVTPGEAYAALRGGNTGPVPGSPPPGGDQLNLPLEPRDPSLPPNPPPAEASPSVVTPPPTPPPPTQPTVPAQVSTTGGTTLTEPGAPMTLTDLMAAKEPTGVAGEISEDLRPARQDIKTVMSTPDVDKAALVDMLGPKLYGDVSKQALVTLKELFQNSFDAIKDQFTLGQQDGNIEITTNDIDRTITVKDDGIGISPEVLGKEFLTVGGTKKLSSRPSGGFGIAKLQTLYESESISVASMKNGKVAGFNATGPQLKAALRDPTQAPLITIRNPTDADREAFPRGHGTIVTIKVPNVYVNPSNQQSTAIPFPSRLGSATEWPVLRSSPLFENINVTLNGDKVDNTGSSFPAQDYSHFVNIENPKWGTARIYISNAETPTFTNLHILSNGLWQFSTNLSEDPANQYGESIPRRFFIDVSPNVRSQDPNYPLDMDRQGFSKIAKEDFDKIFRFIQLKFQQEGYHVDVENFGEMQYLTYDTKEKRVKNTMPFEVKPPTPPKPTGVRRGLKSGDKIVVKEGKLVVNGRTVPSLSQQDVEKFRINTSELKIPQKQIKGDVILHDNTAISPTGAPASDPSAKITMTQLGVQKYGNRFYEFNFLVGNLFKQLKGVVQKLEGYANLADSGVGISFDKEYRGVNIIIPFRSIFVNPLLPQYSDKPMKAAAGVVGTMVHELAHEQVRAHNASFQSEFQALLIQLNTHPDFNFQAFMQNLTNIYASYWDMFQDLNGVYKNGDVRPRARSFKGVSAEQGGYGGALSNVGESPVAGPRGSKLSDWVAVGETSAVRSAGLDDGNLTTQNTGNDPSFGQDANQRALDRETGSRGDVPATQQQPEFSNVRKALSSAKCASACASSPGVAAAAAHADRMNLIYKYMVGIDQLASINPSHTPLRRLREEAELMHIEESQYQNEGIEIVKNGWMRLGAMADNLTAFLDDMSNMRYRTPKEVANKVARHPTPQEFNDLVAKHKLDARALGVFKQIQEFFNRQLDRMRRNAVAEAMKINEPLARAKALTDITARVTRYLSKPYFPHVRFGRHFVTVRDSKGNVEWFSTYERSGLTPARVFQDKAVNELRRKYPAAQGFKISAGLLPEQVEPFLGMPDVLLAHIAKSMTLSPQQQDALEQLMFHMSPALSFEHFMEHKKYTPGYSNDFMRAFSRYAFFSSRYIARTKWIPVFRQRLDESEGMRDLGIKESHIADYVRNWLNKAILDARGDYGIFKGAIFFWAMGYSLSAATNNLFQMPMIVHPWVSGRYGSAQAGAALGFQYFRWKNFQKRGNYPDPKDMSADFEFRALSWMMKTGRITETQAAELATLMNSDNVTSARGLRKGLQTFNWFVEKGSVFFEAAEQVNRRVTARAVLQLAMQQPNSKAVDEAVANHPIEYDQLVNVQGFSPTEARATVAAIEAVQKTNFIYARYARAPFMRGRIAGTVFVFKQYIQNVVFLMLAGDRRNMVRYLIPMMLLGGLGAVPGYEDVEDLLNAFLKLTGIDSSLEKLMREFIQEYFGGGVPPDLLLHGFARRGFGIPWLLDALGGFATGTPGRSFLLPGPGVNVGAPVLDMSKGISGGPLLPLQIGKILAPMEDREKEWAKGVQKASGATFSAAMNIIEMALPGNKLPWDDMKRYEKGEPRVLAAISRGYRAFTEERSRGTRGGPMSGSTVLKYNPRDTEQLMEIIFQGMGYNTLRESQKWDSIMMKAEHEAYLKGWRSGLLAQLDEAIKGQDRGEIDKVIGEVRKYNVGLQTDEKGMAINGQQVLQSMRARERNRVLQEMGLSATRGAVPMRRGIQSLFPESVIDVQKR